MSQKQGSRSIPEPPREIRAYDREMLASAIDALRNGEELSEAQQRVLELYENAPGQGLLLALAKLQQDPGLLQRILEAS